MKLLNTDRGVARLVGTDTVELLDTQYGELGRAIADGALADVCAAGARDRLGFAEITARAPVTMPHRYFIIGLNYLSHADEAGMKTRGKPVYGIADGDCVIGPEEDIVLPTDYPDRVDYEGEIGVVIGTRAENVAPEDAWNVVAGLTAVNDVSARDLQRKLMKEGGNFADAKAFPTFKPTGPVLVTVDEVEQPLQLALRTRVNGEARQDGNAKDMIHGVAEIIAFITSREPLLPGDILCTGTPDGVGAAARKFLSPGDVVEIQIADWPALRNRVAR